MCVFLKALILSLTTKITSCLLSRFCYFHSSFLLKVQIQSAAPPFKNKAQFSWLYHMDFDDFIPAPSLRQFPGLFPHFYFYFWCGLKHRTFITLQFWWSEVWNRSLCAQIKALAGIRFFKALERLCFWSLPACRSCPSSLAHAPDSGRWSLSHMVSLWHWTLPLPLLPF